MMKDGSRTHCLLCGWRKINKGISCKLLRWNSQLVNYHKRLAEEGHDDSSFINDGVFEVRRVGRSTYFHLSRMMICCGECVLVLLMWNELLCYSVTQKFSPHS